MHERDIVKLKAIRSKNPQDRDEFATKLTVRSRSQNVSQRNPLLRTIIYEHKNDSQRTWQTISELTSRKSNTLSTKELIVNGVSINKTTDLANAFNELFSTIGPKLANEIPSAASRRQKLS